MRPLISVEKAKAISVVIIDISLEVFHASGTGKMTPIILFPFYEFVPIKDITIKKRNT
jgi:hypothetical protein